MVFILCFNLFILFSLLQDQSTDFNDLGKLLLGGVLAAIVVAIGFTFVRLKLRDKKPATSNFISIASVDEKR